MTEQRQRRIDTLNQAARRKSETKTKAAETAIRTLVKRGEPVTFQAVQRTAGVSHSFLYTHPALRERIEHLRQQNRAAPPPAPDTTSENNIVLALTAEIARLNKRLRDTDKALRDALAQAHGENLELRRELARRGSPAVPTQTRIIGPC
jgi:predicted Zn-dependent protease